MTPEEKIKYVKDCIDAEAMISPKGPFRYKAYSVGHPDNPDEWELLSHGEHIRILMKLEQEKYIKNLTPTKDNIIFKLEKVEDRRSDKVKVDFTQKGKTSTDYLMEAVNFFKNEYNKIRISGLTYEYPLGDNLSLSNYDPEPDEVNFSYYRRIAIERLHEVGLVISVEFEERVIDDYGSVFDYAHCKINEEMLLEPDNKAKVKEENVEKVVETVIRHEHKHRFENSIQEKDLVLNVHNVHKEQKPQTSKFPYKIQSGTVWEKFYIQFRNAEAVTIRVSGHTHDTSYADMGFADRRTGKPNTQWGLLLLLAKNGGSLTTSNSKANDKYKKHKQLLSDTLKGYFSMDTDPFKSYEKDDGYAVKMTLVYSDEQDAVTEKTLTSEVDDIFQDLTQ